MSPALGTSTNSPFSTAHRAGPPLALSQPARSVPLNRRIASDGGSPGLLPGSTLGGTGDQVSVSSGLGSGLFAGAWAKTATGNRTNSRTSFFMCGPSPELDNPDEAPEIKLL